MFGGASLLPLLVVRVSQRSVLSNAETLDLVLRWRPLGVCCSDCFLALLCVAVAVAAGGEW